VNVGALDLLGAQLGSLQGQQALPVGEFAQSIAREEPDRGAQLRQVFRCEDHEELWANSQSCAGLRCPLIAGALIFGHA
jgi:hypothetical protein